jgi:Glycosyl transferase family 90
VRYPELLDAGITHTATESVANALEAERLTRARVSEGEFGRYRYQIDIDGNSNAWSGLFIKLLTGSPVLKIQSRKGYRQWYYDKLVPWYNFVPISAGMADLPAKLCWLAEHDHEAREIGQRGRELALSMTCEKEIAGVLHAITCAVREAGLASGQCALTEQNGPPTDAILVKVGTNHGTRLLMDMIRGELRHGPATSPDNVYLAIRGDIGQLMYLTPEGVHYKIASSLFGVGSDSQSRG